MSKKFKSEDGEMFRLLREAFEALDVNGDGSITQKEAMRVIPKKSWFSKTDTSGDGKINFNEFCEASARHLESGNDESKSSKARDLLRRELNRVIDARVPTFDDMREEGEEESAKLVREELRRKLIELFRLIDDSESGTIEMEEAKRYIPRSGWFEQYDLDGDKKITLPEFVKGCGLYMQKLRQKPMNMLTELRGTVRILRRKRVEELSAIFFRACDRSGDGMISQDEAARYIPHAADDTWFSRTDENCDGKISLKEFQKGLFAFVAKNPSAPILVELKFGIAKVRKLRRIEEKNANR